MNKTNPIKHVLLEWLNGNDKGKLTVLGPEWIRDFDPDNIDYCESYVVEWRAGKRPPCGWTVFDAKIIQVSATMKPLEKRLSEITAQRLQDPSNDSQGTDSFVGERSDNEDEPHLSNTEAQQTTSGQDDMVMVPRGILQEILAKQNALQAAFNTANFTDLKKKIDRLYHHAKRAARKRPAADSDNDDDDDEVDKVEISPGTGVHVSNVQWLQAGRQNSGTAFVRVLLGFLVPPEVLIVSNLMGGQSKNLLGGTAERRTALDPKITEALYAAALKRFPAITRGQFGSAINGKITSTRSKMRKN